MATVKYHNLTRDQASLAEANTSLAHQRAAESKTTNDEARDMAARLATMERDLKAAKEREKVMHGELQAMVDQDAKRDGSVSNFRLLELPGLSAE